MATAGRSLDYAPSLFHHHPTTVLAYSLSRPSPSSPGVSTHPRSPRCSHYRVVCRFAHPFSPVSLILVVPTTHAVSPRRQLWSPYEYRYLSRDYPTVSFRRTDVVPPSLLEMISRSLPQRGVKLSLSHKVSFARFFLGIAVPLTLIVLHPPWYNTVLVFFACATLVPSSSDTLLNVSF